MKCLEVVAVYSDLHGFVGYELTTGPDDPCSPYTVDARPDPALGPGLRVGKEYVPGMIEKFTRRNVTLVEDGFTGDVKDDEYVYSIIKSMPMDMLLMLPFLTPEQGQSYETARAALTNFIKAAFAAHERLKNG